LFFWAYEAFSLWDNPWWTAWIAITYFVSAFVADALFRAGTFCKYLCPIGQFNYVQSLVSPLELKVLSPAICSTCSTKDCIRGRGEIPGCNARLFQPHKSGNMDCTFCLDCVHACPHENVGLLAGMPGAELWRDRHRSGIGAFSRRPDLAALVLVLTFGSLANAAQMVGPVVAWQDRLGAMLGNAGPWAFITGLWLLLIVAVPIAAVGTAAVLCRRWGQISAGLTEVATRFSFALVPLGFGMWLAHYGFHLLTSWQTAIAALQRAALQWGVAFLGEPQYQRSCCRPAAEWILPVEILFLDFGLLLSMYAGYRIAISQTGRLSRGLAAFAPWGVLIVLFFAVAIWIVFQPMQMRGTMSGAA
jgi:hypothetical protein